MYNTGNSVPSSALEDMADNAQVFDGLVTQTSGTVTDRLGNVRRPFQQIVTDMGFNPVSGSFQSGATITEYNQCLLDSSKGTFYSWGGALPKVVPAGSTPATAGGVGVGAWSDKTDLTLRSEINIVVKRFASVADMVADSSLTVGALTETLSRNGGGYGGAFWDVVLASTVTINTYDVVGSIVNPSLAFVIRVSDSIIDTQLGAVPNHSVDSLAARQACVDLAAKKGIIAVLSAGTMQTGPLRIKSDQEVWDFATRANPTRIPLSIDATALRIQTNGTPVYKGGYFMHFDYDADGATKLFQSRGSRTGIGLDVFGDIVGGSSVQATMHDTGFEGFMIGGKYAGCFNSAFYDLTMKRNDIQTLLLNDTNSSVKFYNMRSNLDCVQHIIGDPSLPAVGLASSGATFYGGEFEDAVKYPWFNVKSGTSAWYEFHSPYSFENNNGTDPSSEFAAFKMSCAGRFHMYSGAMNSTGKSDSRLFLGYRGSSTINWDIKISNTKLDSLRTTGADFDVDYNATLGDSVVIDAGCTYSNTNSPTNVISAFGTEQTLYKRNRLVGDAYNWYTNTVRMKFLGMDTGVDFRLWDNAFLGINTNGGNSYNKGGFVFRNGTQNTYLWAATSGKLYIKTGSAPTNELDGTVVGTQS